MKKLLLILLFLGFNAQAEITEEEKNTLWNKQIQYLTNLKTLLSDLDIVSAELDQCRESYYSSVDNDEKKNEYLTVTKDYSTQLVVTSTILNQAITSLESKMETNKDKVLNGLIEYKDSLDRHLEKEEKRNNRIKRDLQNGLENLKNIYCKG